MRHLCLIPRDAIVTQWQRGALTWSGPRPRTWAAAIRSLFWLAYREGGRDGKHENIGDGRRVEEGIEHPGFSRTENVSSHTAFQRRYVESVPMYAWAKQACP